MSEEREKHEQEYDDDEKVEIIDLPEENNADGDERVEIIDLPQKHDTAESAGPAQTTRPGATRHEPGERLRAFFASPRRRGLVIWLGMLASAALLLLVVLPPSLPAMTSLLPPTPTPTAPLLPGDNLFYLSADVPWMSVRIDHHPVSLPIVNLEAPLQLARGRHLIEWSAAPFPAKSCTISVPISQGDTCFAERPYQTPGGTPALLIPLQEHIGDLPTAQQSVLFNAIQQALQAPQVTQETVQPGEPYGGAPGSSGGRATQPLRATLRMTLNLTTESGDTGCQLDMLSTANMPCLIDGQNCVLICTIPAWQWQPVSATPELTGWHMLVPVMLSWDFVTQDGRKIANNLSADYNVGPNAHLVMLNVLWDGSQWQARLLSGRALSRPLIVDGIQIADDPACVAALNALFDVLQNSTTFRIVSGDNPASGCLVEGATPSPNANGSPGAKQGQTAFLTRFGTVLTANKLTSSAFPIFPPVNAYERSIVQRLSAQPGQLVENSAT